MGKIREINYQPASITGGYTDRILRINLDKGDISIHELPPDFKIKYIGGRGYALKLLWDEANRKTPFDSRDTLCE